MTDANVQIQSETLHELLNELMDRKYTSKDLVTVTYRTLNYWHEQGFLLFERTSNERQWRKFSFAEIIWIKMLEEFRAMGIAVEKVAKPLINHFSDDEFQPATQVTGIHKSNPSYVPVPGNPEEMHFHFSELLAVCIYYKNPTALRIFMDGSVREVFANPNYTGIQVEEIHHEDYISGFQSFISISIDKILMEVIPDLDVNTIVHLGIINENEIELLKHLSKKELLTITITTPDGESNMIEFKEQVVTHYQSSLIYETLKKAKYQMITYQTISGKTAIFKQTSNVKE